MKPILKFALSLTLSFALLPCGVRAQQPGAEVQQAAARVAGAALVNGRSYEYLQSLTDKFGGRLTGSPAYARSAEWAAAEFRALGLKNVRLEPFTIPNGWLRGYATSRVVAPAERPLHLESLGWAPATPAAGVRADVVALDDIAPDAIRARAAELKGRVVLLDIQKIFSDGLNSYARVLAAVPVFQEVGASALLVSDFAPNNVLNAFSMDWGAHLSPLPVAQVGLEDGRLLARLLKEGPVTVEFKYDNRTTGPVEVNNVVAELPGRERPDEWVIVGAHLDSWDYGTGAQDNGAGVAQVLEAARAVLAAGQAPRRSIRFALWGGEEQGLLGSAAYARAHAAELGRCVAALNTDNGAGHPKGWKVEGRADVRAALAPISHTLLRDLGGEGLSNETTFDTDHGPFMLAGVPALDLWVDMARYNDVHHKTSDTLDKVDRHNLAAGAAVLAVTAYAVAERPEPLAPHLDHAAVGKQLDDAKLTAFLKAVGVWQQ
ncbi:MAG TPA: M20/M25/M40 family metallo-hydrolase [Pyrinomonadaceae bacterium]|jgi:Iap family predicted aminopeptidase